MRFLSALTLALVGTLVEGRPVTESGLNSKEIAKNDGHIVSRGLGLGDTLHNLLGQKGDTTETTYGNDRITTTKSAGTTGDRVGFSWHPVSDSKKSG